MAIEEADRLHNFPTYEFKDDFIKKYCIDDQYFQGYGYKKNIYWQENASAVRAKPF